MTWMKPEVAEASKYFCARCDFSGQPTCPATILHPYAPDIDTVRVSRFIAENCPMAVIRGVNMILVASREALRRRVLIANE